MMHNRVSSYAQNLLVWGLLSLGYACSSGELHTHNNDSPSAEKTRKIEAETNTVQQSHDGSESQEGRVSRRKNRLQPNGPSATAAESAESALPPNNLAGAFLVTPKLSSCLWEKKPGSSSVMSLCGVSFLAVRNPDLDKSKSENPLGFAEGFRPREATPLLIENRVAGMIVRAVDPEQAAALAQENFIASELVVYAGRKEVQSENRITFKYAPGKYVIYGRSELESRDEQPRAVAMALAFRKVVFSSAMPATNFASAGDLFDGLIANLLLKAGLLKAEPAQGLSLVEREEFETGLMATTELLKSNIQGDLQGKNASFDRLFLPE